MGRRVSLKSLLWLFVKFVLFATAFFAIWVLIGEKLYLPLLGWLISVLPAGLGKIQFLGLRKSELIFRVFILRADVGIDAKSIAVDFAPFWALVLASPGTIRGRFWDLLRGTIMLFLLHIIAIFVILKMTISGSIFIEGIKIFIDGVLLPLAPVLLWFMFMDRKAMKELLQL
jgi:hypothetical protein